MRTFLRRQVARLTPNALRFKIDGEPIVCEYGVDSPCRRCRKPLKDLDVWPVITAIQKPPDASRWYLLALHQPIPMHYKIGLYHARCIPPNVFHAAPGSRPGPGRSRVVPANGRPSPHHAARPVVRGKAIASEGAV